MDAHRAPGGQQLRGEAAQGARDPAMLRKELDQGRTRRPLDRESAISTLTGPDPVTMLISPSLY